ncbi:hypothetical protein Taro_007981, partial [Colocasia esculenta]|nr:hypothetical protein [Colocasia esculenta]
MRATGRTVRWCTPPASKTHHRWEKPKWAPLSGGRWCTPPAQVVRPGWARTRVQAGPVRAGGAHHRLSWWWAPPVGSPPVVGFPVVYTTGGPPW